MMSFVRLMAMALALATTSSSFEPRDQYSAALDTKKPTVPDLQVGCADGTINIDRTTPKRRRKRAYVPWSGQVSYSQPYQSIQVWKPPLYALQRPYYIPIYGVQGKPPIFFPPQPLNTGVPKDNPYKGPEYLPPREDGTTKKPLSNRFNDEDDRPVWDLGETTPRPSSGGIVPTRAPRPPPGAETPPPVIHGAAPTSGGNDVEQELAPPPRRPPGRGPPGRRPPPTTPRPREEPTRCVWAIISCCSTTNDISYDCFEERGCPGAFWDSSPCDGEYARAAIAAALNYYN